jgi:hypothetical protein
MLSSGSSDFDFEAKHGCQRESRRFLLNIPKSLAGLSSQQLGQFIYGGVVNWFFFFSCNLVFFLRSLRAWIQGSVVLGRFDGDLPKTVFQGIDGGDFIKPQCFEHVLSID